MPAPLLLGAAKGLLGAATKKAVKDKSKETVKKFVSGKGGKKKGGALVKREKKQITKAKVKPTESFVGGSAATSSPSSSSTPKASIAGGEVNYEEMTKQLEGMVGVSEALKKAYADQYKQKEKESRKKDIARQKAKREERESQLESKSTKSGSIGGNLMAMGDKFNIFGFLLNTLMGGLAVMFLKNFETIKKFFSGFGELFNEKMNFLRWGLIAFRKPIQKVANVVIKIFKPFFKKLKNPLKKVITKVGTVVAGGLKKIGIGIYNFAKNLLKKVTSAGSSGAKAAAAKGATSRSGARGASNTARKGLRTGPASGAAKKKFTAAGARRLTKFSTVFKRVPLIGPLIAVGIDMAMGETIDRAVVGAIGSTIGATIGGFIGTGLIPIPGVGTWVGAMVGSALGDYLSKSLYGWIIKKVTGEDTEPLVGERKRDNIPDRDQRVTGKTYVLPDGQSKVWNGSKFVTPQEYQQQTGNAPTGPSTPRTSPLSGTNADKAKKMHDYIVSKGYTSAQAKGIVANIERESTFNAKAMSGDDGGYGGLFQWKGSRQTSMVQQLVRAGDWRGQIDYALKEDVGPRYKKETANMSAFDASMWWAEKWERPASLQNARNKHNKFLPRYNFGAGASQTTQSQQPVSQTTPQATQAQVTQVSTSTTIQDLYKGGSNTAQFPTTSGYGMRKHPIHGDMRMHKGVDIAPPGPGYFVGLKVPGKVTLVSNDPNGYGKFVIITSQQTGMSYMFAHMATINVKVGDNYTGQPIGEMGTTGGSTGIHLHYEVYKGGKGGPEVDPTPYMNLLTMGKIGSESTTTTAQVAPTKSTSAQTARRVEQRASYEGGGSEVVTVPMPVATGDQQVSPYNEAGVGGMVMSGGSTKALLNSYYKSKLMGFLYKQG